VTSAPPPAQQPDAVIAGARLLVGTMVDNAGLTRAKSVPGHRIATAARDGIGLSPVFAVFCADDHITETARYGGPVGDMRVRPDLSAAALIDPGAGLAWAPFDQYDQEQAVMETCQRSLLRRQDEAAGAAGLDFLMAYEMEFTVFADSTFARPATAGPAYGLRPWLQLEEFSRDLLDALATAGVGVETLHTEYGPGQLEVSMVPRRPVAAADQAVLARLVIQRTAQRHGRAVSFAPVTMPDAIGNGCHLHFSATSDGRNVFAGGDGPFGLTAAGSAMIGGLVAYLPEACGLLTPSVLSYDRLVPGLWAGAYACWGAENREAAVRFVPGTAGTRDASTNVEVKTIDGTSNPYLAAAAVLAMAMAGLAEERTAPEPVQVAPDQLPPEVRERDGIRRLPAGLGAALALLDGSALLRAALGSAMVDCLVAIRQYELATYGDRPQADRIALLAPRY
jgi:glutamine synthetase